MSHSISDPNRDASQSAKEIDLRVSLGRLQLPNPIMVASGTFGYAREMAPWVELERLGGILPKTVTPHARVGNRPARTVETPCGLLNSIGLDNDGIDRFIEYHLPYLASIGCPIVVSIAAATPRELEEMVRKLALPHVAGIELNLSCPNVTGGIDFGTDPRRCGDLVRHVRRATDLPILAKLTPNVADLPTIAHAAAEAGADAISVINTLLGMAIDWRGRLPMLGNVMGGLSGPAIKPVALRCVYQVSQAVDVPVVGIGGIGSLDDVMEFLVAGASAVQIGTANFYDPTVSLRILDQLPAAIADLGATSVNQIVGSLSVPQHPTTC